MSMSFKELGQETQEKDEVAACFQGWTPLYLYVEGKEDYN